MSAPGLDLVDVVRRFGEHAAVDGASLAVNEGEIVALLVLRDAARPPRCG